MATRFLDETRRDVERAIGEGADLPPRMRVADSRPGHATPEFRTFLVPLPEDAGGASPEVLAQVVSRYGRNRTASCLFLTFDVLMDRGGTTEQVLVMEARDRAGTRLFWMQPFHVRGRTVHWGEPEEGGWQDPGAAEMILDSAFGGAGG